MEKFVDIFSKDKNSEKENFWFRNCQQHNIPFVTIKIRTKFADIHWDYITYPIAVDKILNEKKDFTLKKAVEIFNRYANNKSEYRVSATCIYFDKIDIS